MPVKNPPARPALGTARVADRRETRHNSGMAEDFIMRMRLQEVLAYRQLQSTVRSGANRTLFNAGILLFLDYVIYLARGLDPFVVIYSILALLEFAVGLWKKFFPTLEAVLVDGFVLA